MSTVWDLLHVMCPPFQSVRFTGYSLGWGIPFAVDTEDDTLWKIVNGSSTLPQTIVLDRNGTVIYNQKGSVTPEVLAALYEKASKG